MPGSFTTPTISATIAEGGSLTVTITPSSALGAATTVRWVIVPKGKTPISSSDFSALTGLELQCISLQYGDVAAQLAEMSAQYEIEIVNAGATLSIDDMAALTSACDLVVCVDTMNGHLAGGLGVDCFVVLPFSADWRWHDGRDDTPWYAGMRLFRQPAPADWQGVVAPLRAAVQEKFNL